MSQITRRDFLAGISAAGIATLAGRTAVAAETPQKVRRGTDLVPLGRSGLKTTLLGLGTGTTSGSQQRALGSEGFTKFVRYALDRGIRYVDTADSYKTHTFVRDALAGVPRDQYFIQTKTFSRDAAKARADVDRFLKELNVPYIDSLLMHCMTKKDWPTDMRPVMEAFEEAKTKGKIRAYGFSCHGWDPLAASANTDWPDIQLVRINPFGDKMDGKPEDVVAVLKKAHAKGRGIIGMKIYGESGFGSRQKRLQSIRWVLGLGCVDCFTIGFSNTPQATAVQQLDETLEHIEKALA